MKKTLLLAALLALSCASQTVAPENGVVMTLNRANTPDQPVLATMVGFIDPPCQPRDCCVVGNTCFVAGGLGGICVIDVSDPANPRMLDQIPSEGFLWKLSLKKNIMFAAAHDAGLGIYEMEGPRTPKLRAQLDTGGNVFDFAIRDDYAFLADGPKGLTVVDISNPFSPAIVFNDPCRNKAYTITLCDDLAIVTCGLDGMKTYDISDPKAPRLLSTYTDARLAIDVAAVSDYAFLSEPNTGIMVLDISDPARPVLVALIGTELIENPMVESEIVGDTLYAACMYGGLKMFDISDPRKISLSGRSNTNGPVGSDYARTFGVEIKGDYAYMSTFYAPRKYRGLQVLRLDTDPTKRAKTKETVTAQVEMPPVKPAEKTAETPFEIKDDSDAVYDVMSLAKIDKASLSFDIEKSLSGAKYRLAAIKESFSNPFGIENLSRQTAANVFFNDGSIDGAIRESCALAGAKTAKYDPFDAILGEVSAMPLDETALSSLPEGIRDDVILIVKSSMLSSKIAQAALSKLTIEDKVFILDAEAVVETGELKAADLFIDKMDFNGMAEAAACLATTIGHVRTILRSKTKDADCSKVQIEFDTPYGKVVITGTGDDTHTKKTLLTIDLGGDDLYTDSVACSMGAAGNVSVLVDMGGNDRYMSGEGFTQGCGVLGIGFLYDCEGDDAYGDKGSSINFAQGAAMFGIGILWDGAGNDTYYCDGYAQGAACFGVGLLYDNSGNDSYAAFYCAQAFGAPNGVGMLADASGNDIYMAGDKYPDAIRLKYDYSSHCQGAGYGNREFWNPEKGLFGLPGGVGILLDAEGDDRYEAGGFAQGTAYWDAMGILIDLKGNDSYKAVEYAQGGCVHLAIGAQFDYEGDDVYSCISTINLGAGKDDSIGIHADYAGDDRYESFGESMGAVMGAGLGLFIDKKGNDIYRMFEHAPGVAMIDAYGGAEKNRGKAAGIFMDLGGEDIYELLKPGGANPARNGGRWSNGERAIGLDK